MINYTDLRYSFDTADYVKSTINDIAVVDKQEAILQAIITRLLIRKGEYVLNPNLGSELYSLTRGKSTAAVEERAKSIILAAIKPEIDAGNVRNDVTVTSERTNDNLVLHAIFTMVDGDKQQINLLIQ
jgi:phage gp46-like protein